jgi:hypothetical protein
LKKGGARGLLAWSWKGSVTGFRWPWAPMWFSLSRGDLAVWTMLQGEAVAHLGRGMDIVGRLWYPVLGKM